MMAALNPAELRPAGSARARRALASLLPGKPWLGAHCGIDNFVAVGHGDTRRTQHDGRGAVLFC